MLKLGQKNLKARVTLDTIYTMETALDKSIMQIAQSLSNGHLKVTEQVAILLPVIRAGANDVSEKEVGEMVYQAGIADTLKAIGDVVTVVMSAGQAEGNVEEAVE